MGESPPRAPLGADPPRPLPALHRVAPRLFYGWFVVAAAAVLAFVAVGIGFYGQAVWLDALPQAHGWSKAKVSGAASLFFITSGLAGPLVGRAVDRFGARGVIVLGALLMSGALIWIGRVRSPAELSAAFVLMAAGYALAGSIPNNAVVTHWFVALRARAMSLAQTGVSLGGIVLVPLSVALIERHGLAWTTSFLAVLVSGVAIPVALWALLWDPVAYGLEPDGGAAPSHKPLLSKEHQARLWTSWQVLGTRSFWMLALAFAAVLFSQMSVLIHEISLMREHMSGQAASLALAATAGASIVGRFAGGVLADRYDLRRLGVALFCVQALAIALLASARSPAALFAAAILLGLTIGNVFMLQSLLAGELFGIPSFGRVFGMLLLFTQLAGGTGPVCLGLLYERWGGYPPGLLLLAAISLGAALVLSRVRPATAPS